MKTLDITTFKKPEHMNIVKIYWEVSTTPSFDNGTVIKEVVDKDNLATVRYFKINTNRDFYVRVKFKFNDKRVPGLMDIDTPWLDLKHRDNDLNCYVPVNVDAFAYYEVFITDILFEQNNKKIKED